MPISFFFFLIRNDADKVGASITPYHQSHIEHPDGDDLHISSFGPAPVPSEF